LVKSVSVEEFRDRFMRVRGGRCFFEKERTD
jgi:hypothetical protein